MPHLQGQLCSGLKETVQAWLEKNESYDSSLCCIVNSSSVSSLNVLNIIKVVADQVTLLTLSCQRGSWHLLCWCQPPSYWTQPGSSLLQTLIFSYQSTIINQHWPGVLVDCWWAKVWDKQRPLSSILWPGLTWLGEELLMLWWRESDHPQCLQLNMRQ